MQRGKVNHGRKKPRASIGENIKASTRGPGKNTWHANLSRITRSNLSRSCGCTVIARVSPVFSKTEQSTAAPLQKARRDIRARRARAYKYNNELFVRAATGLRLCTAYLLPWIGLLALAAATKLFKG